MVLLKEPPQGNGIEPLNPVATQTGNLNRSPMKGAMRSVPKLSVQVVVFVVV